MPIYRIFIMHGGYRRAPFIAREPIKQEASQRLGIPGEAGLRVPIRCSHLGFHESELI